MLFHTIEIETTIEQTTLASRVTCCRTYYTRNVHAHDVAEYRNSIT